MSTGGGTWPTESVEFVDEGFDIRVRFFRTDMVTRFYDNAGNLIHNNIPGEGRVAHDTGILQWELVSYDPETGDFETGELLKSGGKHPDFDGIDWCSMVD